MCNKRCFTKREADSVLKYDINKHERWRRECRTYYCEEHSAWHLTSQEYVNPKEVEELKSKYKKRWKKLMKNLKTK